MPPTSGIDFVDRNGPAIHAIASHNAGPLPDLGGGRSLTPPDVHTRASRGVEGSGSTLPHGDAVQRLFSRHDISHVQAFTGSRAVQASRATGAQAYATKQPSLRTAAHGADNRLQRLEESHGGDVSTDRIHKAAHQGIRTSSTSLPYTKDIQKSFGRHDISGIRYHNNSVASQSSRAMRARAYSTAGHVVSDGPISRHTAAHEAAHYIQQRGGVRLKGSVGKVGDVYERNADAVGDAVVQGKSAESLLDPYAGVFFSGGDTQKSPNSFVQRKLGMEFQTVSKAGAKIIAIGNDEKGTWNYIKKSTGHGVKISMHDTWHLEKDQVDAEYITKPVDERTADPEALADIVRDMITETDSWLSTNKVAPEVIGEDPNIETYKETHTVVDLKKGGYTYRIAYPNPAQGSTVYGSPQVTMGIRLDRLTDFLSEMMPEKPSKAKDLKKGTAHTFGKFGVKETKRRIAQYKKMLSVKPIVDLINTIDDKPFSQSARGVLSFAVTNLASVMGYADKRLFKDTTSLMHRTTFAGMYKSLDEEAQGRFSYHLTDEGSPIRKAIVEELGSFYKEERMLNPKQFKGTVTTLGDFLSKLAGGFDPWRSEKPKEDQLGGLHRGTEQERFGISRETDIGYDTKEKSKSKRKRKKDKIIAKTEGAILEVRSLPRMKLGEVPKLAKELQAFVKSMNADFEIL